MKIFSGTANEPLAKAICASIKIEPGKATIHPFPDGETFVKIEENVRGEDVFIIQPTSPPTNHNLMELFIMMDAVRRASAKRITAVLPFYGYARQDRKDQPRVPITAKLVANLLVAAGANRILTVDLHAQQIQGFFDIPVDHLYASPVLVEHFQRKGLADIADGCIVAPDVGGIKQARAYAKLLGLSLAIVDKRRVSPDQAKAVHVIGEVQGKRCILVDDMISTGGTIAEAAKALVENGATEVHVSAAHGVFCGPAKERLDAAPIKSIVVTDTIPKSNVTPKGVTVLSVGDLLGDAILRIHQGRSVSKLFPQT